MPRPLPQYQKIAKHLRESIESGRLTPGARLPSVRRLAEEHEVSLLTALQALRLLEQERYVHARPKSGFYVRPARQNEPPATAPEPLDIAPLDEQAETHLSIMGTPCRIRLDLANGEPALYPVKRLGILMRQQIYRDAGLLGSHIRGTGYPMLKQEITRRALDYGCDLDPRELLITNGCIESLALALRAVTQPGDAVAVESPTYFVIFQMLRNLRLKVVEIPTSATGMDLNALEKLLASRHIAAVLCIANANNPTGVTLPMTHKHKLVELARRYEIALIEDDIYGDTYFGTMRPKPLRSLSDQVILCSSFSKTLAPGIRVGWVAGGRWASRIASLKYTSSMATPIYPQAAIAEFLRTGGYDHHLRRLRQTLANQIRHMRAAILRHFPAGTQISAPSGGYVLWVRLPEGSAGTRPLFEQARAEGIGIAPGHLFATDERFDHHLRLNAGFGWNPMVDAAIARLAQMIEAAPPKTARGT